jgi:hypothetical protein
MPETGVKTITRLRDRMLLSFTHKAREDSEDVAIRHGFHHIGIIPADVIDSVSQRQDAVQDILPAALVEGDVIRLQPPLKCLYDY